MMSNLKERFERSCRLCAQEQDVTLLIFGAEAEAMLLQNKLNKYLLIEVDEDDKLPKNICIQCCTKLQTVCDFIDTAHKSQEILLNLSIELDQFEPPNGSYEENHIITKSEPEDITDEESKITSMEISVDPMIVLQNCEGMSPNVDITCQSNNEDVSHLHGLDGENVTIKLIKRGDNKKCENDSENEHLNIYTCTICNQNFETEFSLKKHYWTHDLDEINKQDYTCSICKEEFIYKNKLIQHLKIHKTGGICKICGRLFRTAEKLTIHMGVHTKDSFFTCKICGRSYDTLSNLRTHSVSHSTERPYECHLCPKKFKRNQDLKFHINQHTGAKPYKCPFCDKAFASSGNCYSHRSRMHPGRAIQRSKITMKPGVNEARPYTQSHPRSIAPKTTMIAKGISTATKPIKFKCHLCAHTFMKRDNFTYHMYQHTGEKPFHCSFCSDQFVTRRGLLIHHDIKHPTKNRPLALLSRNALLM